MSDADTATSSRSSSPETLTRLPFPPVTKSHILHCSYHFWYRLYRSITPKARLIPLTPPFLSYLREDGIVLPPDNDHDQQPSLTDTDSGIFSAEDDSEDEDALLDPSIQFREVHQKIKATIDELGGKVTPKLNWSAPKDATWIAATNSMECRTPSDIYLLLKSSDFITHDLEHAFDDCEDEDSSEGQNEQTANTTSTSTPTPTLTSSTQPHSDPSIPYHLVLRKYLPNLNPALEFRCFVRNRTLLCLCQRDLNHFAFLAPMRDQLLGRIQSFFDHNLKATFPDPNIVFDVYLPNPHTRVWLLDINPWAPCTDPLLFSWLEILTLPEPDGEPGEEEDEEAEAAAAVCRLSIRRTPQDSGSDLFGNSAKDEASASLSSSSSSSSSSSFASLPFVPEFRLVAKDDPEAYAFNTPRYSAHKLPRDVVDAAASGDVEGAGGLREFVGVWKDVLARRRRGEEGVGDGDDSD